MSTPKVYYPAIDGLRFVAAALVVLSHGPAIPGLSVLRENGWLGVDLFLCISAFLIVRLLRIEYALTGAISYRKFYIRRALRILPLYLGYTTAVFGFFILTDTPDLREVLGSYLSHIFMVYNVIYAVGEFLTVPFTQHLWTISLEEQAYFLIPFLVGFVSREQIASERIAFLAALLVVYLIMCRFVFILMEIPFPFTYTLLFRADAFVVGFIAALVVETRRIERGAVLLTLAGLLAAWGSVEVLGGLYSGAYQTLGYTLIALAASCIVLGCQAPVVSRSFLGSAPLRYLGKISYGIYIYHLVCISLVQYLLGGIELPNILQVVLIFGLTILVAAISYEIFEKRFLRLKERYTVVKSRTA